MYSEPCQTSKIILFKKMLLVTTKANSKLCQTFEMELFQQIVTSYRDEFRILPNNYGGALVFL